MAAGSRSIFRNSALERLSSPDQLDRLVTVTSPIGWAALAALGLLLAAIVGWGVLGHIPTRLEGAGILVSRGGQVYDAMAPAGGTLAQVAPIGTHVDKGDVVATLDDTEGGQDLQHARSVLAEQEELLAQLIRRLDDEIAARIKVDAQQRENLRAIIESAKQRQEFYAESLRTELPVVATGFITKRFVQDTRQQLDMAEQEGRRARNDLLRLDAEELDQKGRRDTDVWRQQQAVNAARRTVEELSIRVARGTRIVSPIAGHVTEVKASVGTVVPVGKPILSIEIAGEGLELVMYVPPEHGKEITAGMEVRIEPATVKKEEFGTLIGRVLTVSEFPISADGMMATLQNSQLVTRFSAHGAPYAARVSLAADPNSRSGYAWTSAKGPSVVLSSGTTATAEVTVREQAPIALVLPLLRAQIGSGG
jgi:HlyD family secretion protein